MEHIPSFFVVLISYNGGVNKKINITSQRKKCPVCKKDFHNNKKLAASGKWDQIVYCSDVCRRRRNLK